MDEVIEVVARRNDLDRCGTILLRREVNDRALIEQLSVGIGKENDDGRRRAPKFAFLYRIGFISAEEVFSAALYPTSAEVL